MLAPWEFVVLRAAAARILDGAGDGPDAVAVARRADADLATVEDPNVRAGVRQVLTLVEYGTPLRRYFRTFSRLAPADQDRVLEGLERSRFTSARVAFGTVKLFALYYHYTDPVTWPALGYEGPWTGWIPLTAYTVDYGGRNGTPFTSGKRPFPPERG